MEENQAMNADINFDGGDHEIELFREGAVFYPGYYPGYYLQEEVASVGEPPETDIS